MGEFANDLDRIRAKYGTQIPAPEKVVELKTSASTDVHAPTFVVEGDTRTILTAPAREMAAANEGFLYIHGRFVEADRPNSNGAYWTTADLEMGEPTVAGGPLNWLHQDRRIIGSLLNGRLVRPTAETAAAGVVGNHIESTAAVWEFLFPGESATIQHASADKALYYSMECVSKEVQCVAGDGLVGCGESFPYATYLREKSSICEHLREHSSTRRFVDPVFLGGAVIVPPVKPGWAHADVQVVRQAAEVAEQIDLGMNREAASLMVEQILAWANAA